MMGLRGVGGRVRGEYNQNSLYECIQFLKN